MRSLPRILRKKRPNRRKSLVSSELIPTSSVGVIEGEERLYFFGAGPRFGLAPCFFQAVRRDLRRRLPQPPAKESLRPLSISSSLSSFDQ
jgi:hypothetical protein